MRLHNEHGFTLVEVMTVVAIIAIMAAVAAPNFSSWTVNAKLKGAARELFSNMQNARMQAVKSNTTVTFTFTPGTGTPCVGGSYTFSNGSSVNISGLMSNKVCLSTPTSFPGGFLPTGLPSGAGGKITISHPDSSRTYTISMNLVGGISLQ